ncbi:Inositol hexakisphosphate kinase 1 [Sarcoptes scabiei]|uniref:Kinase n=1 Tax=Sarcoptes scabiei TaxID=52283 RepID=A0A834R043_SARSC|nr:Inositol hexakisphosphate kinase 1 [Sarcoptes scabiei]
MKRQNANESETITSKHSSTNGDRNASPTDSASLNQKHQKNLQFQSTEPPAIELEPFIHQVGGRSAILVLGKFICKPINKRELAFYETLDDYAPSLKPFVALFNGIISVNFEESDDGYLMITTKSRVQTAPQSSSSATSTSTPTLSLTPSLINNNGTGNLKNGNNDDKCFHHSSNSPYQKFVTKYRIKLVRPINEIIIESHEHDLNDNRFNSIELDSPNQPIKRYFLNEIEKQESTTSLSSTLSQSANHQTHLIRSRSTSISIPNFEDGNSNQSDLSSLFDNQLFINEVGSSSGDNGFRDSIVRRNLPENSHNPCRPSVSLASPSTSPKLVSRSLSTTKHNPWVLKTFSILSEFNESMKEQKFILLENLTSNFEYPCIMDLKMGTRLHDDLASQTKIESHESKVNETTSGALGLRVTGIQVSLNLVLRKR